jgi:hypothetical protein
MENKRGLNIVKRLLNEMDIEGIRFDDSETEIRGNFNRFIIYINVYPKKRLISVLTINKDMFDTKDEFGTITIENAASIEIDETINHHRLRLLKLFSKETVK